MDARPPQQPLPGGDHGREGPAALGGARQHLSGVLLVEGQLLHLPVHLQVALGDAGGQPRRRAQARHRGDGAASGAGRRRQQRGRGLYLALRAGLGGVGRRLHRRVA